jgi:hypothetical protein
MANTSKKNPNPKSKRVPPKASPAKKTPAAVPPRAAASAATPVGGARQYAEPQFVPLQPGEVTTGEATEYSAANQFDSQYGALRSLPPRAPAAPDFMNLADVLGAAAVQDITAAGQLVFHSVGDTGADKQFRVVDEADVAKAMADDLSVAGLAERASFFYHLGDVVYEFGQADCYYGQFYEPYCMYNAPIFAIPGNHDGMVWSKTQVSLQAFLANFCSPVIQHAENASSLHRTTMNQPGVYFTLEAPFASIVGLYSNTPDKGPGVIATPDPVGPSSAVGQAQKNFLIREVKRLAVARAAGHPKAFILALHHPPYKGSDASVKGLCNDLDEAFTAGGLWPDLVLSGHEHDYARYTRTINGRQIPYVIAGCGGYNLTPTAPASDPTVKVPQKLSQNNPALRAYIKAFGYLKIKVNNTKLAVVFNSIDPAYGHAADSVVVDLTTHQVTEGAKGVEPL